VVHHTTWVLNELFAHGVDRDLHEKDEEEKLSKRERTAAVSVDDLNCLWLEAFEVLLWILL
jgi:hypothetical protein